MLWYLIVGIETSADSGTGLLVHVHIHMLLQSIDKSLYVNTVLFTVFGVVSSGILAYIIDQNSRSILARFLHIVCIIMIMWLKAKTEGLMCLWMMLDTMIKNILKARERAVASNEMPRHSIPLGGTNVLA